MCNKNSFCVNRITRECYTHIHGRNTQKDDERGADIASAIGRIKVGGERRDESRPAATRESLGSPRLASPLINPGQEGEP